MDNQKNFLTIGESSKYLGVSIDTLRRWEKRGKINAYRSPGGHRYFRKEDLEKIFGTKYERHETTQPQSSVTELKLDEERETSEQEKQENQLVKSYFKDKLNVPRYIKEGSLLKFEKLLQPASSGGSALNTQNLIQNPLEASSILQPSQDKEIDRPSLGAKETFTFRKSYLFLMLIVTLTLISLTIALSTFTQKPKLLSPIP